MEPNGRVIVVAGEAVEPAVNDRCVLTVVLRITREHAADAIDELAALASKVVSVLHERGFEQHQIATRAVTVQDWYDQQGQRVTGQQATYTLAIDIPSLDEVGSVLQQLSATARNALQVQSVALTSSDTDGPRAIARANAVADAEARAGQLAEAAGVRLGALLSIEEGAVPWTRPFPAGEATRMTAASAPVPIEGGTHDVTVRVTLTFAIAD